MTTVNGGDAVFNQVDCNELIVRSDVSALKWSTSNRDSSIKILNAALTAKSDNNKLGERAILAATGYVVGTAVESYRFRLFQGDAIMVGLAEGTRDLSNATPGTDLEFVELVVTRDTEVNFDLTATSLIVTYGGARQIINLAAHAGKIMYPWLSDDAAGNGFSADIILTRTLNIGVDKEGTVVFSTVNGNTSSVIEYDTGGSATTTQDTVATGVTTVNDLLVGSNYTFMSNGYTDVSARTGGIVVNVAPTADAVQITRFQTGVLGAVDPVCGVDVTAGVFLAGDIVQISGAGNPANNGLFEVVGHAGNELALASTLSGVTAQQEDFSRGQLIDDGSGGTVTKVLVSVLRAGTDGVWESGRGSTVPIAYVDIGGGGGGPGVTDHGALTGLGDDDHAQYLLASGTRVMAGNLDMGSNNVTNVGTVDGRDVATDGTAQDGHIAASAGVHGVTGSVVGTTGAQTITDKVISDASNTIGANELRTTGASVVIDTSAPPATGQALVATSATVATWQAIPASGETNTASNSGSGQSLVLPKAGVDLPFKGISAASAKIAVAATATDVTIDVDQTQITGTGALNSGSITSGFGDINNGSNAVTTGSIIVPTIDASSVPVVIGAANATGVNIAKTLIPTTVVGPLTASEGLTIPTGYDIMLTDAPVATTDAANKAYVDAVAAGLTIKSSVNLATDAVLPAYTYDNGASGVGATITATSAGALSIDGTPVMVGDRVLVWHGVSAANGIYDVTNDGSSTVFVLTRSEDADNSPEGEMAVGMFIHALGGTNNGGCGFALTASSPDPVVIGTSLLTFTEIQSVSDVTGANVGTGGVGVFESKSGNTLNFKNINVGSTKLSILDDTGNDEIKLDVVSANIDHGDLAGIGDDDHTQYTLLAGRSGGQTLTGSTLTTEGITMTANSADATGAVAITGTDGSSTVGTGALTVAGGVGVAENLTIGGVALASTAPTLGGHLTNKTYVDAESAKALPLTGGTMTGAMTTLGVTVPNGSKITLVNAPSAGTDAANKTYVDAESAKALPLTGGTMTGAMTTVGVTVPTGNTATLVDAPSVGTDAANKAYVDTKLPLAGGTMTGALTTTAITAANLVYPTVDGTGGQVITTDGLGNLAFSTISSGGGGDMIGPASSTDNAVARFNLATGKIVQDSGVLIDDSNNATGVNDMTISGQVINPNPPTSDDHLVNKAYVNTMIDIIASTNINSAFGTGGVYDHPSSAELFRSVIIGNTIYSTGHDGSDAGIYAVDTTTGDADTLFDTDGYTPIVTTSIVSFNVQGIVSNTAGTNVLSAHYRGIDDIVIEIHDLTGVSQGVVTHTPSDGNVAAAAQSRKFITSSTPNRHFIVSHIFALGLVTTLGVTDAGIADSALLSPPTPLTFTYLFSNQLLQDFAVRSDDGIVVAMTRTSDNTTFIDAKSPFTGAEIFSQIAITYVVSRISMFPDDSMCFMGGGAGWARFTKYSSTGVLDTSFGTGGVLDITVAVGTLQDMDMVYEDGYFYVTTKAVATRWVFRITSTGALDTTYGTDGYVTIVNGGSGVTSMIVNDGTIFITGDTPSNLVKYNNIVDIVVNGPTTIDGLMYPVEDGTAGQVITTDGSGNLTFSDVSGGDMVGPASATDNAIARFDTITGKLVQDSGVLIDDSNNISGANDVTIDGDLTIVSTVMSSVEIPLGVVSTFGAGGTFSYTEPASTDNTIVQALIVGGAIYAAGETDTNINLYSINKDDGKFNTLYDTDGIVTGVAPITENSLIGIASDTGDDSIIIACEYKIGGSTIQLRKYANSNGALITTSLYTPISEISIPDVELIGIKVLQSSATDIIIAGESDDGDAFYGISAVKVTLATGALDTSFNTTGIYDDLSFVEQAQVSDAALQSDGGIIIVGLESENSIDKLFAHRITDAGALDGGFNGTGVYTNAGYDGGGHAVGIFGDDSICIGIQDASADLTFIRLTTAGVQDTSTFGTGGVLTVTLSGSDSQVTSMDYKSDGFIYVSATHNTSESSIFRISVLGVLDTSYGTTGFLSTATEIGASSDTTFDGADIYAIGTEANKIGKYTSGTSLNITDDVVIEGSVSVAGNVSGVQNIAMTGDLNIDGVTIRDRTEVTIVSASGTTISSTNIVRGTVVRSGQTSPVVDKFDTNANIITELETNGASTGAGSSFQAVYVNDGDYVVRFEDAETKTAVEIPTTIVVEPGETSIFTFIMITAISMRVYAVNSRFVGAKTPVRCLRDGGIAIPTDVGSGDIVDGVTLVTGDRFLQRGRVPLTDNGIYVVVDGSSSERTSDYQAGLNVIGTSVLVEEGTDNGGKIFVNNNAGTAIVGTDTVTYITNEGGDMVGPDGATDNAIARFDATTGKLVQDSSVLIDDSNNVSGVSGLTASGVISTTDTTTSTTPFTGSLVVGGGVGVAENLNVGGTVDATLINLSGAATENKITVPDNINNAFIIDDVGGQEYMNLDTTDANPTLHVNADAQVGVIAASGIISATNATSSTNATTGALVVTGGVGIGENLNVQGDATVTGTAVINGNLIVNGTTTSIDSEVVNISDNYLAINSGHTAISAETGGLVVNYLPTGVSSDVGSIGFVAGDSIGPRVFVLDTLGFVSSDIIQISGSVQNDGLYEIEAPFSGELRLRGIGGVATVEDFTQNQLVTDTDTSGTISKINVSVTRVNKSGGWECGMGSSTPITYHNFATEPFVNEMVELIDNIPDKDSSFGVNGVSNDTVVEVNVTSAVKIGNVLYGSGLNAATRVTMVAVDSTTGVEVPGFIEPTVETETTYTVVDTIALSTTAIVAIVAPNETCKIAKYNAIGTLIYNSNASISTSNVTRLIGISSTRGLLFGSTSAPAVVVSLIDLDIGTQANADGFGDGGMGTAIHPATIGSDIANDGAVQSDGGIISVGIADDGAAHMFVHRFTFDGITDTGFATNGVFSKSPITLGARRVGIFADDSICIEIGTGGTTAKFMKLSATGVEDTNFGTAGELDITYLESVTPVSMILKDGMMYVTFKGFIYTFMSRFDIDGVLDTTFGTSGIFRVIAADNVILDDLDMFFVGGGLSRDFVKYTSSQTVTIDKDLAVDGTAYLSGNAYPTLLGDPGQVLTTDGTGVLTFEDGGDVTGPAGATANSVPVLDATGKILSESSVIVASGNVTGVVGLTASGIINTTNATSSTNATTGALLVTGGAGIGENLNVVGTANLSGNAYPIVLGDPGQVLTTNGSGTLMFEDSAGGATVYVDTTTPVTAMTDTFINVLSLGNLTLSAGDWVITANVDLYASAGRGLTRWFNATAGTNAEIADSTRHHYCGGTTVDSMNTGTNMIKITLGVDSTIVLQTSTKVATGTAFTVNSARLFAQQV
jgi:uncharacterized delta-60 repeat protein